MADAALYMHLFAALAGTVGLLLLVRAGRLPEDVRPPVTAVGVAVAAETIAVALRWAETGHPPVFGTFENSMASSWSLLVAVVIIVRSRSRRSARWESIALLAWVPLTAAYGLFFSRTPYPLTISERSILVDVHVAFAWAAYVVLLWACMIALRVILRGSSADTEADALLVRTSGIGFVLFSGVLAIGAIYSFQLFTRYFTWEIVETLSVCLWLAYGLILHQRLFFGWTGKRLAWLVLATLPLLLATFWVWSVFSGTYHFFEITEFRAW